MKTLKLLGAALAVVTMTFTAEAAKTAKAVVADSGATLKFVYDETNYGTKDTDWFSVAEAEAINPTSEDVPWYGKRSKVTKVVFAESFAAYQPTSVASWLYNFAKLTAVEDVAYWDTSKTTTFYALFANCSGLTTLDLAGLSTASAKNVGSMFQGCTALTTIAATDSFAVPAAADSNNMFKNCTALVGGNGTPFDGDKTSGEYARIDKEGQPGYFTSPVAKVILSNDGKTLTFVYDLNVYPEADKNKRWFLVSDAEAEMWSVPPWHICTGTVTKVVFNPSFANCKPKHCSSWFEDFGELNAIDGIANLDTSAATSFSNMFRSCSSLTALDVTHFDTANVKDMQCMFYGCSSLTALDVTHFDTSKVSKMNAMFHGCSSLTALDLSSFDTAAVYSFTVMFCSCENLVTIIAADSFVTSYASETQCNYMFDGCTKLVGGNGTAYDGAKVGKEYARADLPGQKGYFTGVIAKVLVEDGGKTLRFVHDTTMPSGTKNKDWFLVSEAEAQNPDVAPAWVASASTVTKVVFDASFADYRPKHCGRWFYDFGKLVEIDGLENLDTSAVTSFCRMFALCVKLAKLDVSGFDTANATDMFYMFFNCSSLTSLDLSGFDTANVERMAHMFRASFALEEIRVSDKFVTTQVTSSGSMFSDCNNLVGGNGTAYDPNMTDSTYARIDKEGQPGYFTAKDAPERPQAKVVVEDDGKTLRFVYDTVDYDAAGKIWYRVSARLDGFGHRPWSDYADTVTKVVFDSSFAGYRPRDCSCWFDGFEKLASIVDIAHLDTSNVTQMGYMFYGCSSLTALDVTPFDTSKVVYMYDMFCGCSSLTALDVTHFDTSNVTDMYCMFYGCSSLTSLDLSSFDTSNVECMECMFADCSSLETIVVSEDFTTGSVTDSGEDMFDGCSALVGGAGTAYNPNRTDKAYARIDAAFDRGYFTGTGPSLLVTKPTGKYLSLDLVEHLGIEIPSDVNYAIGDKVTVKVENLAKGLKLVEDKQAHAWTVSGVPTETVSCRAKPMFARVTVAYKNKTKAESLQPIPLEIEKDAVSPLTAGVLNQVYGPADIATLWPEVADANVNPKDWTFKGWPAGLKYNATAKSANWSFKKDGATVKATAAPYTVYGTPTKAGEFPITATHKYKIDGKSVSVTYSAVLTVWGSEGEKSFRYADQAYVAVEPETLPGVTAASGLPTGVKFTKNTASLTGTPTKPGVFAVTVTKTDKSKETFLWKVEPGENDGIIGDIDWFEGGHPLVDYEDATVHVMQGFEYVWMIPAAADAKVSVKGLPTGLKLVDNRKKGGDVVLSGVPTKAERKVVTFTTVRNGVTVAESVGFEVEPNEYAGTYYAVPGWDAPYDESSLTAVITVAAGGTAKLILTENARKTTVSVKFLTTYDGDAVAWMKLPGDKQKGIPERLCIIDLDMRSLWIDDNYVASLFQPVVPDLPEDMVLTETFVYKDLDGESQMLYLSATVNAQNGLVGVTGKLSDGTAIKATTYYLGTVDYYGEPIFAPFLVTDKQKRTLSITLFVDNPLRMNGKVCACLDGGSASFPAPELKNKKVSDMLPGPLYVSVYPFEAPNFDLIATDAQLATKLGTGGLAKLTFKDPEGVTWTCEMVPVIFGSPAFVGIATGKKGKDTWVGMAKLYLPEYLPE